MDEKNKSFKDFIGRSQGNLGIKKIEDDSYCFNKKELNKWRAIYITSLILWFFIGGELADTYGFILFIISFYIPYFLMNKFVYKNFFLREYMA